MVQFNLPQNSKIEVGKHYKDITSSKNLKKGTILSPEDLILKRSSSNIFIHDLNLLYNKELLEDVESNTPITEKLIINKLK